MTRRLRELRLSKKIILEIWTCPNCLNDCEWAKGTLLSVCKCGGYMVNTHTSRVLEVSEPEDGKYVDFDPKIKFGQSVTGVSRGRGTSVK